MKKLSCVTSVFAVMTLSACGGGGGDSSVPSTSTAEGVYTGTLTGSNYSAFELLVLENGEYWSLYGNSVSGTTFVAGFIQGNGTSNNGTFTSSNAKDFGTAPAISATVNASYVPSQSISGTISESGVNIGFSGNVLTAGAYNYSTPASVSSIAGNWSLTSITGETISINVGSNGAFSAVGSSGCAFTGSITPRPSGKNVFNVAMTFGASPCALPNTAASGIAISYPLASGGTQLLVTVVEGTRTYGAAAFGTR